MKKNTMYALTAGAYLAAAITTGIGFRYMGPWQYLQTQGQAIDGVVFIGEKAIPKTKELLGNTQEAASNFQNSLEGKSAAIDNIIEKMDAYESAITTSTEGIDDSVLGMRNSLASRFGNSKLAGYLKNDKVDDITKKVGTSVEAVTKTAASKANEIGSKSLEKSYDLLLTSTSFADSTLTGFESNVEEIEKEFEPMKEKFESGFRFSKFFPNAGLIAAEIPIVSSFLGWALGCYQGSRRRKNTN